MENAKARDKIFFVVTLVVAITLVDSVGGVEGGISFREPQQPITTPMRLFRHQQP